MFQDFSRSLLLSRVVVESAIQSTWPPTSTPRIDWSQTNQNHGNKYKILSLFLLLLVTVKRLIYVPCFILCLCTGFGHVLVLVCSGASTDSVLSPKSLMLVPWLHVSWHSLDCNTWLQPFLIKSIHNMYAMTLLLPLPQTRWPPPLCQTHPLQL